ncbi:DEKNAAC101574 [Brettanomyces naardenensis]|uniref:Translation machinery-associated protein 22 n=1 Tax=Brettanomyces naardenensis TaxID=13370 RepID=A0A448YIA0_BRENA|nr:DEKNAAC101574 [Brettanomyces naardenensis]
MPEPIHVLYCGVCSLPVEYCEFGKTFKKCKQWLQENNPNEFNKLYNSEAPVLSSLSKEREAEISESLAKMQLKEERKEARELRKLQQEKILIKRIPRTKHKNIIAISNLDQFDIDMKKLAKKFASKFATGASVSKNLEKKEEIVIQGDVGEEVEVYLTELLKEKGLEGVKLEIVDEKRHARKKPA